MCGICGATGISDKSVLRSMTESLRHRGPDDTGLFVDDAVMLGQCRLSIIDLKTGKQPIFNEDRSIVIVYNGEIYNFRKLRRDLESMGHSFSTNSDTEVVVHAYEEHGPACLTSFNGMFAFTLYDSKKHRLFVARDRQGIKPLYYAVTNGGELVFASEIKSILQHPGVTAELNSHAASCFLTLRYVPLDETLFRGIRKLLPGHYMLFSEGKLEIRDYWKLNAEPTMMDVSNEDFTEVLKRSVERHMISDVPVGVYLSGGLDSGAIVSIASQFVDRPLNTFCMGFGENEDELQDARTVARHFGTEHHETIVSDGLLSSFPDMIWHMDFPKRNLYPYYLARLASKHVKVVLSGLGGDELFAGYDFRYAALIPLKPNDVNDRVNAYLGTQARDVPLDQNDVYGPAAHANQCATSFLSPFFTTKLPFMDQVLAADFGAKMTYDFLPVDDATSMAQSVETRVPFLDNELVDLAFQLPFESKFRNGKGKFQLRRAVAPLLPPSSLDKKKQGFGPNPYLVYKKELRNYSESFLPNGKAVKLNLVNGDWVSRVLSRTPSANHVADYNKLWDCLGLEVFLRIYFDGEPRKSPTWSSIS